MLKLNEKAASCQPGGTPIDQAVASGFPTKPYYGVIGGFLYGSTAHREASKRLTPIPRFTRLP